MNRRFVSAIIPALLLGLSVSCSNKEMVEKEHYERVQDDLTQKEKALQDRQAELLDLKNQVIILRNEVKDQESHISILEVTNDSLEYRLGIKAREADTFENKLMMADSELAALTAEKKALENILTGNQQQIQYSLEAEAIQESNNQLSETLQENIVPISEPMRNDSVPVRAEIMTDQKPVTDAKTPAPQPVTAEKQQTMNQAIEKAMAPVMNITSDEFRQRYDEALKLYFARDFDKAISDFQTLIQLDNTNDLSDNCQYWIGESYYSQEKFAQAADAFKEVLSYPESNKKDHSEYKIGMSYLKLGMKKEALLAFKALVQNYPDSELVVKVQEMISSGNL